MKSNKHQEVDDLNPIIKHQHPHPSYYEHIKTIFVEGELDKDDNRVYPKISQLARRFKLKPKTLDKHAVEEKWKALRAQFQLKLEALRQDKRVEILGTEAVQFDKRCFDVAKSLIDKISEKLGNTTDLFQIESICRSLEKAQKVGRLATGESTSNARKDLTVTFSQGLNMIRKNLESHPDVLKQLKDDTVDGDPSILPIIDLKEKDDSVYERLNIKQED